MKIARSYAELKDIRAKLRDKIAFVPTMGALHDGHLALVGEARKYADNVVVSIFVNPTQFGKNEDFGKYPRTIEADIEKLKNFADILYLPSVSDIYPDGEKISVKAGKEAEGLDGEFRPGHFDGVCTVVSILFDQLRPDFALFGEKDYQQLMVIKEMCEQQAASSKQIAENNCSPTIIGVPTLRESDGLAMSSRNVYLSAEERKLAPIIYSSLRALAKQSHKIATLPSAPRNDAISKLEHAGFKIQYLEQRWNRLLVAAYLGNTRLIDNVPL